MELEEFVSQKDQGTWVDVEWSRIHGWLFFFCFQCAISVPWLLYEGFRTRELKVILIDLLLVTTNAIIIWLVVGRSTLFFTGVVVQSVERILVALDNVRIGIQLLHMSLSHHDRGVVVLMRVAFSVPMAIAWLIYFRRSRRVRAVFGRNL